MEETFAENEVIREKYITECVGWYHIFGGTDKIVDIATTRYDDDIAILVPKKSAEALVKDQHLILEALIYAIKKHGDKAWEVFSEIKDKFYTPQPLFLEYEK